MEDTLDIEMFSLREDMQWIDDGPSEVEAKSRLHHDVAALQILMSSEGPPLRRVRSNKICQVFYGFIDA